MIMQQRKYLLDPTLVVVLLSLLTTPSAIFQLPILSVQLLFLQIIFLLIFYKRVQQTLQMDKFSYVYQVQVKIQLLQEMKNNNKGKMLLQQELMQVKIIKVILVLHQEIKQENLAKQEMQPHQVHLLANIIKEMQLLLLDMKLVNMIKVILQQHLDIELEHGHREIIPLAWELQQEKVINQHKQLYLMQVEQLLIPLNQMHSLLLLLQLVHYITISQHYTTIV